MTSIPFNKPYITGRELGYIEDVFATNQYYGTGKYTALCVDLIRKRINSSNVLLTDSCTSALEIVALLLRKWGARQEIILPSYTFSSTASAFARAGFDLVFVEVNPKTLMVDPASVRRAMSEYTCAVVAVHYGSFAADVYELKSLCESRDIYLVEDAAQAFGSSIESRALGTIGDFGTYSFHETKNLHAGLSGALVINVEGFSDRARHIWERGTNRQEVLKGVVDKYSWVEIGGSFYPTELQAAFLFAQLENFDVNKAGRQAIFDEYMKGLLDLREAGELWFPSIPEGYDSNCHAFWVLFNSEEDCDKVRLSLVQQGISAYIGYVPLHSSPVGIAMGNSAEDLPITESVSRRVLRLPFFNALALKDVERVCKAVRMEFVCD